MLRKCVLGLFVFCCGVATLTAWRGDSTNAQARRAGPDEVPVPPVPVQLVKPATPLPISQVVLFNSGVGYFQRSGMVESNTKIDLQFPAHDINDLIRSLIVDDGKGRMIPLRYDSQEPIEKTLRSFGVDLSSNPSFGQILNQTRGEKVEVTLSSNNTGLPATMTGVIVGMETQQRPAAGPGQPAGEKEFLNLLCTEGLRNIPLDQVQRMRFLNPTLETELRRALDVVATGHDAQKKSVRLNFKGEGKQNVKVGYVVENPIWKTTYRVVLDKAGKSRLMSYATIENTSDDDWNDVKLTLVSSRPISFQMDLYAPLFIPRPTIEPELFASLRPPTYAGPISATNPIGNLGGIGFGGFAGSAMLNNANMMQQQALNPMMPGGGNLFQGGNNQGAGGGLQGFGGGGFAGQFGQGGFGGGQFGQGGNLNRYQNSISQNIDNSRLTYQDLQNRRNEKNDPGKDNNDPGQQQANGKAKQQQAAQIGSIVANVEADLIDRALTAEELGNPTRFVIPEKLTLPRQQSAMIPLFDEEINAQRVSIYNDKVHARHPLLGLKLKNTTKQALMQGPITVFDDEQYAGDARVQDLQPGEERFISYAIDTGIEIKPVDSVRPGPEMTVSLSNNQLQVGYRLRSTRTYSIRNRSPENRKVVIEQPFREGWKLVQPEKTDERTRDLYRFSVDVKAGELTKFEVTEELPKVDPFTSTKNVNWTGFATSLGLDVWTESVRTPEDTFDVAIRDNALQVRHRDRRQVTYHLRNRTTDTRTIWLEHFLIPERKMFSDAKADPENGRRFRFKLELPPIKDNTPGVTVSKSVTEELLTPMTENFATRWVEEPRDPLKLNAPRMEFFTTELGFEIGRLKTSIPSQLTKISLANGSLETRTRESNQISYQIRNNSKVDRSFRLGHFVTADGITVADAKPDLVNFYRFPLMVKAAEKVSKDLIEEKVTSEKLAINTLSEERAKALMDNPLMSVPVREALKKGLDLSQKLDTTRAALKEAESQKKEILEEQTRLRTNLEKLPTDSDLYKRYTKKLDQQETSLEKLQSEIKALTDREKSEKKAYDIYLSKLTVE